MATSEYEELVQQDIVSFFQSGIEQGKYYLNRADNKIYSVASGPDKEADAHTGNWLFPRNPGGYNCDWWRDIWTMGGFIPKPCMECWKVVVRPRTLYELFQLHYAQKEMVEKDPSIYCKCGIETRPFVFGNYGGYFYTKSQDLGFERYKQVRAMVDEKLSPDVPVVLKRGCTEYELQHGPSNKYKWTALAEHWTKIIEERCVMIPFPHQQSPEAVIKIKREWIKFAWDRGDITVFQLTNGQPIVPPSCTYHDKMIEEESQKAEVGTQESSSKPEAGESDSPS